MKTKMKIEDLYKKNHYRSIINLLVSYQDKENGLRQRHFRYALMKNPVFSQKNNPKKKEETQKRIIKNMKNFFEDEFDFFYHGGVIVKGCIASKQKLTNYLKRLEDMGVIKKSSKQKPDVRYKLTNTFCAEWGKMNIKDHVDRWDTNEIFPSDTKRAEGKIGDWVLFGLSSELLNRFTQRETDKMNKCLANIEENLWTILELKHRKTKISSEEFSEELGKNSGTLMHWPKSGSLDFWYHGLNTR